MSALLLLLIILVVVFALALGVDVRRRRRTRAMPDVAWSPPRAKPGVQDPDRLGPGGPNISSAG